MSKSTIEIATNDIKELLNFGCLIEKNGKINLKINNSSNQILADLADKSEIDESNPKQEQKFRINPRTGCREIIE